MNINIELKIIDNEGYGYLWRVIKESFLAAGKPFFITDPPHPDKLGQGWKLDYQWPHINRRIWFRLMQNGWKHRGLIFRSFGCDPWTRFPRPFVVTSIVRELNVEDAFYEEGEFSESNGWREIFRDNILVEDFSPIYPDGKFFVLTDSTNHTMLVNTNEIEWNPVAYYQVEYIAKPFEEERR